MRLDPERTIVLVGLSGAGKSAVGRVLAARLGRPFADLDERIEAEAGASIDALWVAEGEAAFRARERDWIDRLPVELRGHVVAAGGGLFVGEENVSLLCASAVIVWLRARVDTLVHRLGGGAARRPLIKGSDPGARLGELARAREEWYARAHVAVDTDGLALAEAAAAVEQALERAAAAEPRPPWAP
jgi:shikimate kinase